MARILAITSTGTSWSDDGSTTWSSSTSLGSQTTEVATSDNVSIVLVFKNVINSTEYFYSSDAGQTFETKSLPFTGVVRSAIWFAPQSIFIMTYDDGLAKSVTYRSTDGITWTSSAIASGFWNLATNGTTIIALSKIGLKVATSTNGTTWTNRAAPPSGVGSDLYWDTGDIFLSVDETNNIVACVRTTDAGVSWTTDGLFSQGYILKLTSNHNGIVLASYWSDYPGYVARSIDNGLTWGAKIATLDTVAQDMVYVNGTFINGTNGKSVDGLTWSSSSPTPYTSLLIVLEDVPYKLNTKAVSTSVRTIKRDNTISILKATPTSTAYFFKQLPMNAASAISTSFARIVKANAKLFSPAINAAQALFSRTLIRQVSGQAVTSVTALYKRILTVNKTTSATNTSTASAFVGPIVFFTAAAISVAIAVGTVVRLLTTNIFFPLVVRARQVPYIFIIKQINAIKSATPTSTATCVLNKRFSITVNTTATNVSTASAYKFTSQSFKRLV